MNYMERKEKSFMHVTRGCAAAENDINDTSYSICNV